MKKLSLQWRITLMTALLIGITCVSINLLLCPSGVYYMNTIADAWKGNSTSDQSGGAVVSFDPQLVAPSENLTIIVDGAQTQFRTTNWYITAAITLLSGILAHFVSGRALRPLRRFAQQAAQVETSNLSDIRLDEKMLPGMDGIEILKALRGNPATARIPVIIASARGTEYDKVVGLDLGADDYLANPSA